ncbi:hypothetical protein Q8F55_005609 [Vanrija albida]|uniref:Cytochrome b561 domain-containing protein n=1 Tax=Vanrija albida TaxID=181172 RepID=A0ABR3Q238_9TREE
MVAPRRRSDTQRPLLDEGEAAFDPHPDTTGGIALADPDDDEPKPSGLRALDMAPTTRDRWSLLLLATGIALFLPLTWALVLTADVSALGWFAPHPPLNALAITLFALGVAPVQPPTPPPGVRAARLATHQQLLAGLAVPLMAIGTSCMWWNKEVHGAAHYTTWHAWFGCATLLWVLVQALVGGLSVWSGGAAFGGGAKAKAVYKYHRLSGYLLIALSLATAFLAGGYSTWALSRGPAFTPVRVGAFYVGIPLIAAGLGLRIRTSKMKFA